MYKKNLREKETDRDRKGKRQNENMKENMEYMYNSE